MHHAWTASRSVLQSTARTLGRSRCGAIGGVSVRSESLSTTPCSRQKTDEDSRLAVYWPYPACVAFSRLSSSSSPTLFCASRIDSLSLPMCSPLGQDFPGGPARDVRRQAQRYSTRIGSRRQRLICRCGQSGMAPAASRSGLGRCGSVICARRDRRPHHVSSDFHACEQARAGSRA